MSYYTKGDVLEVKIEKIVPRGFGLAFAENLTVLVPLSAPGDTLRVRVREIKKRTAFAEIVDVLRPGPKRATPPCALYGTCGGCDLQHLSYRAQLEAKVGIIRDSLNRLGKIDLAGDIPIVPSPNEFEYRSRARWHVDAGKQAIGYLRRNSHSVVDITACPILTPGMSSTLDYLRSTLDWNAFTNGKPEIEAVSGADGRISTWSRELREASAETDIEIGGETYAYTAETFFQANRFLIDKLIETAIGGASGTTALDLYCGVGLFSLPLARRFKKVAGVEENKTAIALAKRNAEQAGLENVKFHAKGVAKFLAGCRLRGVDLVLLDPPRAGTGKETISLIASLKPARISYVSCEPSILARDLRELIDAGYKIDSITALDMFPQTHHVETVAQLSREDFVL